MVRLVHILHNNKCQWVKRGAVYLLTYAGQRCVIHMADWRAFFAIDWCQHHQESFYLWPVLSDLSGVGHWSEVCQMCCEFSQNLLIWRWRNILLCDWMIQWFWEILTENCSKKKIAHNWHDWKSRFPTWTCHEIYRVEAVGLKNFNYT